MRTEGQIFKGVGPIPAIPLSDGVNHVVGVGATLISKPAGIRGVLMLRVESGSFRVKAGDDNTLTADVPTATVADGSGSALLKPEDGWMVFSSMNQLTVAGLDAASILDWYFYGTSVA